MGYDDGLFFVSSGVWLQSDGSGNFNNDDDESHHKHDEEEEAWRSKE